jgi:hypothetical protein
MTTPMLCAILGIILAALALAGLVSYTNFYGIVPYDYITAGAALLFFCAGMAALLMLEIF